MSAAADPGTDRRVDPDFAEEVLEDLYTYPLKRRWVAFALWLTLGWFGAHRFYLDRPGTALAMMFTGGGFFLWWGVDGFLLGSMIRLHNADQELRRKHRHPPRELDFMPPLSRDVLSRPPEWTEQWRREGARWRRRRLAGDVTVLVFTGLGLGAIVGPLGVYEALLAVAVLAALTAAGGRAGPVNHLPVFRALIRWGHRLRLFYYYNKPGSSLELLLRPITGALRAPFRRRDRAEVKLYLQLGGVLTALFLLLDLGEAVASSGLGALSPDSLIGLWIEEAATTFVVIYAFTTPIGAVLTTHLLMRRAHTVPRILSGVVVISVILGMLT